MADDTASPSPAPAPVLEPAPTPSADEVARAEASARENAINIANNRARPGATTDDIVADAEKILAFMRPGGSPR
jgi:hypothetical protein